MIGVSYQYQFPYPYDERTGRSFPRLAFTVVNRQDLSRSLDVDAYLDSGAERSFFNGEIATALGIELLGGEECPYATTTGAEIHGRVHPVRLSHPELGSFDLEVAFSLDRIQRNLLGRDFFALTQIGFREQHSMIFVTPSP